MTILFMNYSIKISDFFSNLSEIFVGEYSHKDKDLDMLRTEILDISIIPTTSDDRKILKDDLNVFLEDTKRAENKIKEELNG